MKGSGLENRRSDVAKMPFWESTCETDGRHIEGRLRRDLPSLDATLA